MRLGKFAELVWKADEQYMTVRVFRFMMRMHRARDGAYSFELYTPFFNIFLYRSDFYGVLSHKRKPYKWFVKVI